MSWNPISGTVPQYAKDGDELASGYYLKFYASGTTTPINMATNSGGGTQLAKCQLNSLGNPITAGNATFIPHINQTYKIALYPTSADADADTNGVWPSVDAIKAIGAENTSNIFYAENYSTLALAATAAAGHELDISQNTVVASNLTLSGLSLRGIYGGNIDPNTGVTVTVNGPVEPGSVEIFDSTAVGVISGNLGRSIMLGINVRWFGAKGDGTTDDITAFNKAKTLARSANAPVYVPPTDQFWRLSTAYLMNDNGDRIVGAGWGHSIIVAAGTEAAISVQSASWFSIEGLYISGLAGCDNGIEFIKTAGNVANGIIKDCNVAYVDGDCYHVENGVSLRFINCYAEMNGGFRPGGLQAIAGSLGWPEHNWWVAGINEVAASVTVNDIECIGCQSNAGGSIYGVRVGSATNPVETFTWIGGLIQGSSSNEEFFINSRFGSLKDVHVESSPLISTKWIGTLSGCNLFTINNVFASGAIKVLNSENTGLRDSYCAGLQFDANNVGNTCFADNVTIVTGNGDGGPIPGYLKDLSGKARLTNMHGNRNYGDNLVEAGKVFFASSMEEWQGGASPSLPCGVNKTGACTVTREATIVKKGTYSCKVATTGAGTEGIYVVVPESVVPQIKGSQVVFECWVYNVTTVGLVTISFYVNAGSSNTTVSTRQAGAWERVLVTFDVPDTATSINLRIVSDSAGTFYVDNMQYKIPNYAHANDSHTVAASGALDFNSDNGYVPGTLFVPTGSGINNIAGYFVNREYRLLFTGARTIDISQNKFALRGDVNFVAAAGDTLTGIIKEADGVFYETSRNTVAANAVYTPTNVVTDRAYDADTVAVAELADVVGTLIADLQARNLIA